MKERGILFSSTMVRALLAGTKTQTRRLVDPKLYIEVEDGAGYTRAVEQSDPGFAAAAMEYARFPYGVPGDRLWVRETWQLFDPREDAHIPRERFGPASPTPGIAGERLIHWRPCYLADGPLASPTDGEARWRPSIHMPRWASRITLEVTEVRVQRLQDISEEDARAEGLRGVTKDGHTVKYGMADRDGWPGTDNEGWPWHEWDVDPRKAYARLWDSINGAKAPWSANPWCWTVSFKRVQP